MEKQIIKTLEQKKACAEIMSNFFAIIAVLYIGFIAYLAFTKEYENLLLAINVWILLVIVAVDNKNEKKNAERLLKNIKYFESRNEIIEDISRNHPWISVEERLPEDNKAVLLWLGGSSSSGKNGLSAARGNDVKVKGGLGAILVIAEEDEDNHDIIEWKAVVVDGQTIKADTWYKLVNGELVEC